MIKNCFTYVIGKMKNEGGYILIRPSRLNQEYNITSNWHPMSCLPHFLHKSNDGVVTQYTVSDKQLTTDQNSIWTYSIKYVFGSLLGMLFFVLILFNIAMILLFSMFWSFDGKIIGDDIPKKQY